MGLAVLLQVAGSAGTHPGGAGAVGVDGASLGHHAPPAGVSGVDGDAAGAGGGREVPAGVHFHCREREWYK